MKVTKHGNSYNGDMALIFICRICGCNFLTSESECAEYYSPEFDETDALATCPECGATCIKSNIKSEED